MTDNPVLRTLRDDSIVSNLVASLLSTALSLLVLAFFPGWSEGVVELTGLVLLIIYSLVFAVVKSWVRRAELAVAGVLTLTLLASFATREVRADAAYLIIDISDNMKDVLDDVGPRIVLTARSIPDNTAVGLMVYGGGISLTDECNDISPLVSVAPKPTSVPQIESVVGDYLREFTPQGPGTLQRAVLQAVEELAGRSGLQKVIILTRGVDEQCGELARDIILETAQRQELDLDICVVAVGPQEQSAEDTLREFADSECYEVVEDSDEIPEVVATVVAQPERRFFGSYYDQ